MNAGQPAADAPASTAPRRTRPNRLLLRVARAQSWKPDGWLKTTNAFVGSKARPVPFKFDAVIYSYIAYDARDEKAKTFTAGVAHTVVPKTVMFFAAKLNTAFPRNRIVVSIVDTVNPAACDSNVSDLRARAKGELNLCCNSAGWHGAIGEKAR